MSRVLYISSFVDMHAQALSRFEAWRKNLDLPSHPELQKLDLDNWPAWQTERSADQLRQIVFGDSQVGSLSPPFSLD